MSDSLHPMGCSPPGSSVHGILQARTLEWVVILFSRGPSQPRDQTQVSCIAGRFLTIWATREALYNLLAKLYSKSFKLGFSSMWTELPDVKVGFWKRHRNQSSNCQHLLDHRKSKRVPEKRLLLLHWLCSRLWLCGSQQTGKFLEMGVIHHPTCLLRNLYAGQEATRSRYGTMDWFQTGKGCILSPCLFNFYAEYIMWKVRLDETQAGIKIAGRNINLRYANDTTPMAESEEELKSLLMRVKEESEKLAWNPTFKKLWSWYPVPSLHGK